MSLDAIAPPLDIVAFAYFGLAIFVYRLIVAWRVRAGAGLGAAIQEHRVNWMLNMAQREQRMLDAMLLGSLSQGNAFFASTSAIAVGGLAATLGSGEKLQAMLAHLPYASATTPTVLEAKQLLMMGIFVYAFFKFAWAFRISHYASIMIGATPIYDPANSNPANSEAGMQQAKRTAALIGIAAEHTNSGMRSFYHAIATIAWFFHPLLFMLATTWVILILARRDFFSRTLRLIRA
ncbi:MAG: DUF599 family protein [Hyphomonadaceae bacterium]|jgi:uncharacterized membrane protein|nr:DUF599 family protein [Hyphomonadaceae bacterium]